jgi:diguanylate cyclase (GGDEF)-like protein
MPETDAQGATALAQLVRRQLAAQPVPIGAVTISFGITEFRTQNDTGEMLISRADAALYQAKREGRNRVIVSRPAARITAVGR